MNKQDLRKRWELTPEEMEEKYNCTKTRNSSHYALVKSIAQAQLNKVLNDPDLAIKGDRGFIYLTDLKEDK